MPLLTALSGAELGAPPATVCELTRPWDDSLEVFQLSSNSKKYSAAVATLTKKYKPAATADGMSKEWKDIASHIV
eukprot:9048311-Pyramimonas_sp.AAC.1